MGPNPTLITGWRQGVAGSQIPLNSVPFFSNLNVFNPISQSQSKTIFSILKNIFLVNLVPFAQISMFLTLFLKSQSNKIFSILNNFSILISSQCQTISQNLNDLMG